MRIWVAGVTAWVLAIGSAPPAHAQAPRAVLPVSGAVVRRFDPPAVTWGSGHRGVDLAAADASVVRAPRDGTVTFAAEIAGRPVLVLSHGQTRSTFEPVVATVAVGTRVARGDPIGRLGVGHACPAPACLHWGLRRGEEYLDPLSLLRGEVVLLSEEAADAIRGRHG